MLEQVGPERLAEGERLVAALRRGERPESLGLTEGALEQVMRARGLLAD